MDEEKRSHPRLPMEVEVEVRTPGSPMQVMRTGNLSHGGLLLITDSKDLPPPGALVRIQIVGTLGDGERPPLVRGRVVRHVAEGFAVSFDENEN